MYCNILKGASEKLATQFHFVILINSIIHICSGDFKVYLDESILWTWPWAATFIFLANIGYNWKTYITYVHICDITSTIMIVKWPWKHKLEQSVFTLVLIGIKYIFTQSKYNTMSSANKQSLYCFTIRCV